MNATQQLMKMQRAFGLGSQNQMLNEVFNGDIANMIAAANRSTALIPKKRKRGNRRKPTRPLTWYGGKQRLGEWIASHFPDRDSYSHYHEVFAGGLGVLFKHDPNGKSESANDLNSELTNFWRTLQCPELFEQFYWRIRSTPLSSVEWKEAKNQSSDVSDLERACAFFIRYRQSFNGRGCEFVGPTKKPSRGMNGKVSAYLGAIDGLPHFHERLRRVEIRNMDCVEYVQKFDHENALFYLDPPYLPSTRVKKKAYEFEMSEEKHFELLDCLLDIKGKFILSGYHSDLYNDMLVKSFGCRVAEKEIGNSASCESTKPRMTEVLWMNF